MWSREQEPEGITNIKAKDMTLSLAYLITEEDTASFVDSEENKWVGPQQSWSKEEWRNY